MGKKIVEGSSSINILVVNRERKIQCKNDECAFQTQIRVFWNIIEMSTSWKSDLDHANYKIQAS